MCECINSVYNIIIVKCSWDGLLEGRNGSCVWSFWYSKLCSVNQTVTVQRGSVLVVRGPEWFCQSFCSRCIITVPGEWGELHQWFAQQSTLHRMLRSDLLAELNQTGMMCRGLIQWYGRHWYSMVELNCISSSCGRLNFLSWRRKYSLCWFFFTMESMWLSHFRSWEMVMQSQCYSSL